jgi:hypothetical protein
MAVSIERLVSLSRDELDALFRAGVVGDVPDGDAEGVVLLGSRALADPADLTDRLIALLARWLVWTGKVFDARRGELVNKVTPLNLRLIRARVYPGRSWLDGREAIVLDYSRTSFIARHIRDEIREVAPGTYLGQVYWQGTRLLLFALVFPERTDRGREPRPSPEARVQEEDGMAAGDVAGDRRRATARLALAGVRLVNGALALFAPAVLARLLGIDLATSPGLSYALRMFGVRTLVIGADLLSPDPAVRARALRQGLVIHASDATAAVLAGLGRQLPPRAAATGALISAGNVALALAAQPPGREATPDTAAPGYALRVPPPVRLYARLAEALDRAAGWYRLPLPLGLAAFVGLREGEREHNLHDTGTRPALPAPPQPPPPAAGARHLSTRTADGTFNDLRHPEMGSAGQRFGRNVPLAEAYPDPEPAILEPNPRTVSRELLTRDAFVPATTLNLLAAAWIQFMVRDWLSHGPGDKTRPWLLPLADDDPWEQRPMRIPRTVPDPTRPPGGGGGPPTFRNTETHWWDGSQLYGSSRETQARVRAGAGGKLRLTPEGMLPDDLLQALAREPGWWIGLALLYTLFAREHNAICDRLREAYPAWSDDDLFDRARLVNVALMAKIHTVEWTPAIIGHPTTRFAMRGNWWGLEGERLSRLVGRLGASEVLSGIPGSATDHHGAPYAITEEFVAVYRMHPLIPDDYRFRAAAGDRLLQERPFDRVTDRHALDLLQQVPLLDLFYSFGTSHPGAVSLHNYPRFLQRFRRPDGVVVDLAATDVMRMRELGVPRYNRFRRLFRLRPVPSFAALTDNPVWAEELRRVYGGDLERVDLMTGLFAEPKPAGFGFSDTAFRVFILMASRRLKSDRFFTTDFTPRVYSPEGFAWVRDNDLASVLLRHLPGLAAALRGVENGFAPWTPAPT